MKEIVGIMFFNNGQLLICKSKESKEYKIIEGKVENNETSLQTAIRYSKEQLGNINPCLFEHVVDFIETDEYNQKTHMHIFKYNGLIQMVDFNKIKNDLLTEKEKYIKEITEANVKLKVKKGRQNELF